MVPKAPRRRFRQTQLSSGDAFLRSRDAVFRRKARRARFRNVTSRSGDAHFRRRAAHCPLRDQRFPRGDAHRRFRDRHLRFGLAQFRFGDAQLRFWVPDFSIRDEPPRIRDADSPFATRTVRRGCCQKRRVNRKNRFRVGQTQFLPCRPRFICRKTRFLNRRRRFASRQTRCVRRETRCMTRRTQVDRPTMRPMDRFSSTRSRHLCAGTDDLLGVTRIAVGQPGCAAVSLKSGIAFGRPPSRECRCARLGTGCAHRRRRSNNNSGRQHPPLI